MKYLLSSGKSTSNVLDYVRDLIRLQLYIRKDEIPYYKGGSDEFISSIDMDSVQDDIKLIVNDIINYISSRVTDVDIVINSIGMVSNKINIDLSINGNDSLFNIIV